MSYSRKDTRNMKPKKTKTIKVDLADACGGAGGALTGVGVSTAVIATCAAEGTAGAALMTSGLCGLGGLIGGGMATGIVITAAIPIGTAAAGYGLIQGARWRAGWLMEE